MAGVPSTQRITVEELQGDADQRLNALLRPLNLFIEDVNSALGKNLTVLENLDANIITVDFETDSGYPAPFTNVRFQHGVNRRVSGNTLLNIVDLDDPDFLFLTATEARITFGPDQGEITFVTGLQALKRYTITLLII